MSIRFVPPREPLVDPRTGLISRTWYLFFQGLMDPNSGDEAEYLALLAGGPAIAGMEALAGAADQLVLYTLPHPATLVPDDLGARTPASPPGVDELLSPPAQAPDAVPPTRQINTTAPLQGGGDLTADRTFSITAATAAAPGSMSAADKSKLDGIAAGASGTVTSVSATGANGITVTVGTPTTTPSIAIGAANLTPTTIIGGQWLNATRLQTQCRVTFDDGGGNFELMANGVFNPTDLRLAAGFAGRVEFNASVGNWRISTASTGAAGSAISYTDRLVVENAGVIRPGADNAQSIGSATFRFSQLFAASGTINTSDRDAKKYIGDIPAEWLDAWAGVRWRRFKMKGGGDRWHVGLIAQEVHEAFAACGIDAFEIGLCCYDEWLDQFEEYKNGNPKRVVAAGSRWGLRYDECQAMEAAWMRRELARLKVEEKPEC